MSATLHRLRIRNASRVVTVCARGERVLRGGEMGTVAMVEREEGKGRGVGLVVDAGGKIAAVGYDSEIDAMMQGGQGRSGSLFAHAHVSNAPPTVCTASRLQL